MNVVAVIGRLVDDPQIRQTPGGKSVATFRIACNRKRDEADFFNVVAWERTAEFICQYFGKGAQIGITGRMQSRNYKDKQGNNRTAVEIVAQQVSFCGSKPAADHSPVPPAPSAGAYMSFAQDEGDGDLPF